jgi:hypothetical protein
VPKRSRPTPPTVDKAEAKCARQGLRLNAPPSHAHLSADQRARRKQALRELIRVSEELGLYDDEGS